MAINVAKKFSEKVVERYKIKAITGKGESNEYKWDGVKSVTVYSIPTVPLVNYTRSGSSRYGTPTELEDTIQEMIVTQDKSYSITVDTGNNDEQLNIKKSGQILARQTDEVITPELDKYKFATWCAKVGIQSSVATNITQSNAYTSFLAGQEKLDDANVPMTGRLCYAKPSYINLLKLDPNFIKASELAQNMLIKGQVGEVDGVPIIKAPTSYFPLKTEFILIYPGCSITPVKLKDYKVHQNPPGINGMLIEFRIIFDSFVFDTLVKGIYKHMSV